MPQTSSAAMYERFGVTAMAEEGIRPGGLALTERALEFCRFAPGASILDVGCGNGATVYHLRTGRRLRAVGVDSSFALATEARKRRGSLPFSIGTADRLPFGAGIFDGVFLECALSLMKDSDAVLAECHRVIRTGGRIVISDVYARNPAGEAGLTKLPPGSCLRRAEDPHALQGRVSASGFEIELWEDRSDLLKDFAVRIVWTMGSMRAFWGLAGDDVADPAEVEEAVRRSRPGYHLLIGRKTSDRGSRRPGPPARRIGKDIP